MLNYVEAGDYDTIPMIYWDLIDVCQYKCTYCYNYNLIQQEEYKVGMHHQAWKLALSKLQRLNFDFNIAIHGGEPTLHPELATIVDELEKLSHCKSIVISTNVTAADSVYKQFDNSGSKVSLHMSYHPEYHKKIFDKVVRIANSIRNIKVWVEAILYPKQEYYDQMLDFLTAMKQTDIKLYVSAANNTEYWRENNDSGFDELFASYINETKTQTYKHKTDTGETVEVPEHIIIKEDYSYKGWKCQALSYTIGVDGTIINNCTRHRLPLLIKESDVKKFVTCPQEGHCSCGEMFNYKKFKND
jgi:molybdenum cofactor biosynthesis enzyme MoaA